MPRYIDADEATEKIKTYCEGCNSYRGVRCGACQVADAIDIIEESPTIEAVPVRHGRWIVKDNPNWRAYSIHECSLCGYYVHDTKLAKRDTMRYCQNCGAKMDEEVEE